MRILHWAESYLPYIGGIQVFVSQLAHSLQERGHECAVLTDSYSKLPEIETIDDIPIYRFDFRAAVADRNPAEMIRLTKKVELLKKTFEPDIIHLHTCRIGGFYYLRSQAMSRVPCLYTTHDSIAQIAAENRLLPQIIQSVDKIAAISPFMLCDLGESNSVAQEKTILVMNACPMPKLEATPLPFNPPVLLGIGRLVGDKGFDIFLNAFASLIKEFPLAKAILAGDGPDMDVLKAQANALGLPAALEFKGWVEPEQIPGLINDSTIVVVPSRWQEPFGLAALQAMQMARPVIAAKVGGLPDIILDQQTGLLFEPENADALSLAMLKLISDQNATIRLGLSGRQHAELSFNWEDCVSRYQAIYDEIMQH